MIYVQYLIILILFISYSNKLFLLSWPVYTLELCNRVFNTIPTLYSNVKHEFLPDDNETFDTYEKRLTQSLHKYALNERHCYLHSSEDCSSYRSIDSKYAEVKYNDDQLQLSIPPNVKYFLQPSKEVKSSIIIGVITAENQFVERNVLRNTWCKSHDQSIQCFFCIGKSMENKWHKVVTKEQAKYGDILYTDIIDSYLNLTIIQLQAYKWALKYYKEMKYYIRADTDMYINITRVRDLLSVTKTSFAYGYTFKGAKPFRNPSHKYYIPWSVYNQTYWPTYISGCMCIFSKDVLYKIVEGYQVVRPIHYLDDAYYGQILNYYNISIIEEHKRISVFQIPLKETLNGQYLAVHRFTPIDILTTDLLSYGKW